MFSGGIGKSAKKSFEVASALTLEQKKKVLQEIIDGMDTRRQDFAKVISEEMGAPLKMAAGAQYGSGIIHFKNTLSVIDDFKFCEVHDNITINKLPIGPVGMITPWNWPLNQMCTKIASAIAAGTSFVLKPSEITPGAAHILAQVIDETSLPKGILNLIHGYGQIVGREMSSHPDLEMISFTGSTRAGIAVAQASASSVKRVHQELGGKSSNIILDDVVDLEKSVKGGAGHCFLNSGQSCNAPTKMLISSKNYDKAVEIAVATANSTTVGDPNGEFRLGPIANKVQYEKILKLIEIGIEEGATLVAGGVEKPDGCDKGYYVRPTVFADVTNDMTIAKEEIFGPVLVMIKYNNEEEAINIANDTEYGLAGYVQGDPDHAKDVARKIRAGQVIINGGARGTGAPFGGYKASGNGREHGLHGLEECLETKAIIAS